MIKCKLLIEAFSLKYNNIDHKIHEILP